MIRYAPHIDGTIPAFSNNGLIIPFQHNPAVPIDKAGKPAVETMVLKVKNLNGNTIGYLYSGKNSFTKEKVTFTRTSVLKNEKGEEIEYSWEIGQYYKVQLAYKDNDTRVADSDLAYSSVAIVKYIGTVTFTQIERDTNSMTLQFECSDHTEQIISETAEAFIQGDYSKKILLNIIKKEEGIIQIPFISLVKDVVYDIEVKIITSNGFETLFGTEYYEINTNFSLESKGFDFSLESEYGEIENNTILTDGYSLIRSTTIDSYDYENTSFKDTTVEHGKTYYYGLKDLETGDWSLAANKPIMINFEDMILQDQTHMLRVKFNPKVSSFKHNIQEAKQDTLGGKYPYFFRNGDMDYVEFPISGLISYHTQDNGRFIYDMELGLTNNTTTTRSKTNSNYALPENFRTTNLTDYNIYAERIYREKVLEWLTNGEPKLFRSPTEGNFIVRLMNVSISPNEQLGRMLWTFNCTAYECAAATPENLLGLNYCPPSEVE